MSLRECPPAHLLWPQRPRMLDKRGEAVCCAIGSGYCWAKSEKRRGVWEELPRRRRRVARGRNRGGGETGRRDDGTIRRARARRPGPESTT